MFNLLHGINLENVKACLHAVAKGFSRAPSLKLWRKRPETVRQGMKMT